MPIAATIQRLPAVVRPRTEIPSRMIAPAPRKPIPVTICAATRVGSTLVPKSANPYAPTIVNRHEPSETSRCVRMPASRSRSSRSMPTAAPRPAATTSRSTASQPPIAVALLARSIDGLLLARRQLLDSAGCQVEQLVEPFAAEWDALRGRLHLDESPVACHDDVDVDVGARVLDVVEVEQRLAVDDPDRDRGDRARERLREPEAVERPTRRDVSAADRCAAGASVSLQHVAVEVDRTLAERLEVDDGAH